MDMHALARALVDKQTYRPSSSGCTTPDGITPFPIRLIHENAPQRRRSVASIAKPQNDEFYRFWDRFLATSPHRAHASSLGRRLEQTLKDAGNEENGLHTQESPAASYEQAKKECQAKVKAIIVECTRLNQKYRDRQFEVELAQHDCIVPLEDDDGDSNSTAIRPSGVKRVKDIFEKPVFNAEGACGDDVMQGSLGNCWFIAALVSVAAKPGLMQRLCVARDEAVGVYGFVFHRDGTWIPEIVDDRLFIHVSDGDDLFIGKYVDERQTKSTFNNCNDITKLRESLQKGGEALYFARCRDSQDTWLPLIEKAFAKAHGDYGSLHGGWVGEGTEDLTGGVSISLAPSDIMNKSMLWEQLMHVNDTYLFAGGAFHYKEAGSFGKHAYAVLQAVEHKELRLLKIRNPWGNNKSTENFDGPFNHKFEEWNAELVEQLKFDFRDPGVFWVTFDHFLRYFDSIQRTRLFDETWTVTQQWTSVNVPAGAVSYLDTTFQISLSSPGPVVIVLAQPDVSYFKGLQGRYTYRLHFRVHNVKDTTNYLARSMYVSSGNYMNTRSVSVDLDLEAGDYEISFKVEPSRVPYRTAESVIESEAPYRKQKLLQVGRNFELAHAKGKLREKEQRARKEKKDQARREYHERQARLRRRRHEAKAREKRRKGRIADEKIARERSDVLRKAGFMLAPPPALPHSDHIVIMPDSVRPDMARTKRIKVARCIDIFDNDPNAELDDDDFEWDSDMDGDLSSSSSSEDEKDYYADDPWNALLVLGLRVYSQSSAVTIKVREGNETDDGEPTSEEALSKAQLRGLDTSTNQDNTNQPSASSGAVPTPDEDDKSNTTTKTPHEHDHNAIVETTSDVTIEQKQ